MADEAEFARRLRRAYEGEVFGAAMFAKLAADWPAHSAELRALQALEEQARDCLLPLAVQHCDTFDERAATEAGQLAATGFLRRPWSDFLEALDEGTAATLVGYARLRAASSDPDVPELHALIRHEEALRDFARRSRDGSERPLERVEAELMRRPL